MTDYMQVPVEPTPEMVEAAREHHEGEAYLPVSLYKAMLAAAPDVQGEPKIELYDAMRFALSEMVKWYENISLGNNPAFQYYNLAKKALLSAAPQPTPCQECGGDGAGGEHEDDCAMAQPAEQQPDVALLLSLLSHARCNTCDGSGALYDGHGQVRQCQWCHDRSKALAAYRKQPEGEA